MRSKSCFALTMPRRSITARDLRFRHDRRQSLECSKRNFNAAVRDAYREEVLDLGFVANHFDVVPVRANDEGCIVVRVVVRAQTGRAIVFATGCQSRAMESFDLLASVGRESQVKMRRLLLGLVQAQRRLTLRAELDTVRRRPFRHNSNAERFECAEEERFARCVVADPEFDMIKHEFYWCAD